MSEYESRWIKRLTTNVKGERDFDLAPCTLVIGRNGDGKSGLIDAVTLAIAGEAHSEGLGKKEKELMRLAPPGAAELYSTVTLDDGSVVKWQTEGSTTSAKKAKHTTVDRAEPKCGAVVYNLTQGVLLGGYQALVRTILHASGGTVAKDTLYGKIPSNLHHLCEGVADEHGIVTVFGLLRVIDTLDASARGIASKIRGIAAAGDDAELQPLEPKDYATLEKLRRAFVHGTTKDDVEQHAAELRAELSTALEVTKGEVGADAVEAWSSRARYIEALMEVCELGSSIAESAVARGHTYDDLPCPVCNRKPLKPEYFDASSRRVSQYLDEARSMTSALETVERCERHLAEAQRVIERFDDAAVIYRDLGKRDAAMKAGAVARGNVPELQAALEGTKSVRDIMRAVALEQVKRQAAVVEKRVNRFLPSKLRARIDVGEGSCSISMSRGKEGAWYDFRALSGGERATLIAAFASAIITEDVAPVRILIVDDAWLDSRTMRDLLKSVATSVNGEGGITQAIVCAVEWGTKKVPDGWLTIRLDKEQKGTDDD